MKSDVEWKTVSLELRRYGVRSSKRFPFRVEKEYGSKVWSECKSYSLRRWRHKRYTSVRAQFCKDYYGVRLQFVVRVGRHSAATEVPIVLVTKGERLVRTLTPTSLSIMLTQ